MATGFHIATIAFSVRNVLCLLGPAHPVRVVEQLKQHYHQDIDEEEVRRALVELEKRGMVKPVDVDKFYATDREIYRHRRHATGAMREDDESAWQGWR